MQGTALTSTMSLGTQTITDRVAGTAGADISAALLVASTYALASAAWFWSKNGLNTIADQGATDEVVTKITKRVNGGTIGLADRIKHFKEFNTLLA